jgi:hypothetical protein
VSTSLPIEVLLRRCVSRVRREYGKRAMGARIPDLWFSGYQEAIVDLIWDLYSLDGVLKREHYAKVSEELQDERLQNVTPEDYADYFRLTVSQLKVGAKSIRRNQIGDLEEPIRILTELLSKNEADESKYQRLIAKYPWMLGPQYEVVEDHRKLDDKNIPDFTGVRAHDKNRDILEIKSPFMSILRQNGKFHSDFDQAWDQCEKYLNLAREERDYLRRKGLAFDNPKCYLIAGHKLGDDALNRIRVKQRMNPAIDILTYDELTTRARKIVEFVRSFQGET